MKINSFICSLLLACAATSICEAKGESVLLSGAQEPKLVVNNRILVQVNGKAISVIDVMKKMDMLFYKQYPEYTSSVQARYQFYQANWKHVLDEMIDRELILGDAEESKLVISPGDIRQEMENLFGPNIITNLDKIGLTFAEAQKMVHDDITMRRMMYFRVQSKAINEVTPQVVRTTYDQIAKDNIRDNEWIFNVVTIRHRDSTKAAETANLVSRMLSEDNVPLSDLNEKLKEIAPKTPKSPTVTISEEFHTNEKELSDPYKKILVTLSPNSYSSPTSQKSRSDNSTVVRIFYLNKMNQGGPIPYAELSPKIKDKLIDNAINKESDAYIKKLRLQYHVQDSQLEGLISSNFQPFELE